MPDIDYTSLFARLGQLQEELSTLHLQLATSRANRVKTMSNIFEHAIAAGESVTAAREHARLAARDIDVQIHEDEGRLNALTEERDALRFYIEHAR